MHPSLDFRGLNVPFREVCNISASFPALNPMYLRSANRMPRYQQRHGEWSIAALFDRTMLYYRRSSDGSDIERIWITLRQLGADQPEHTGLLMIRDSAWYGLVHLGISNWGFVSSKLSRLNIGHNLQINYPKPSCVWYFVCLKQPSPVLCILFFKPWLRVQFGLISNATTLPLPTLMISSKSRRCWSSTFAKWRV